MIEAPPHPTLVVAGAGSGKTETMAARVVWMVTNQMVAPEQVLGLTFTRKAAQELAQRVDLRLRAAATAGLWRPAEGESSPPTISTYHAYAGRLVAEHGLRIGVEPGARLLSEAAAWQYAHRVVEAWPGQMTGFEPAVSSLVRALVQASSALAEHLVSPEQAADLLHEVADRWSGLPGRDHGRPLEAATTLVHALREQATVFTMVSAYQEAKRRSGALDFADQVHVAARLAREHPAVAEGERARYRAVLLDEFQDTSHAQLVLLRALFGGAGLAVTAVGDPHQAIYGWRGASAGSLAEFGQAFGAAADRPRADVLTLSTSWRNADAVLEVANTCSSPLGEGAGVLVRALRPRPDAPRGEVRAARLSTPLEEAQHVAEFIAARWRRGEHDSSDASARAVGAPSAAVLCRARSQFGPVVEALRAAGLPVEVVGLGGLLDAPEVIDLLAALAVVHDPSRGESLMRLLTGPVCRLGASDLDALWAWAESGRAPGGPAPVLSDGWGHPPPPGWTGPRGQRLSTVGRHRWVALGRTIDRLRAMVALPLPDLVMQAERALGLDIEVAADPDLDPAWGRAQLDALVEVAAGFESTAERATLGGFVEWLDVAREAERGLEPAEVSVATSAVQVLTVHAAKGLEWDVVAVPGLVEGSFPSYPGRVSQSQDQWQMSRPTARGWAGALGALPYPLRGDRAWLPQWRWSGSTDTAQAMEDLEEFRMQGGDHLVAEERRLAYVAFTRARQSLLLTAPVWSGGRTPRTTSRFLQELLLAGPVEVGPWEPLPDPADPQVLDNPLLSGQEVPWPTAREERRAEAAEVAQVVLEGAAAPTAVTAPGGDALSQAVDRVLAERAARRAAPEAAATPPDHLAASALPSLMADPRGFHRDLRRPIPQPPSPALVRGSAFHEWVEQHYSAAGLLDLDEAAGQPDDEPPGAELPRLRANFLASPWAQRQPVAVEVAVETVIGGISVRGRIDAVFSDPDRGPEGVVIVDWKTGHPPHDPVDAQRRALQLAAYRTAFVRLHDRAPEDVTAAFFYAATGETVVPQLPDEETLTRLLVEAAQDRSGASATGLASATSSPSGPSSAETSSAGTSPAETSPPGSSSAGRS